MPPPLAGVGRTASRLLYPGTASRHQRIEVLLRTHSDEEAELLSRERLGTVFMGEQELAAAMTVHVLDRMRAPANPPGAPRVGGGGRSAPATVLQPTELDNA